MQQQPSGNPFDQSSQPQQQPQQQPAQQEQKDSDGVAGWIKICLVELTSKREIPDGELPSGKNNIPSKILTLFFFIWLFINPSGTLRLRTACEPASVFEYYLIFIIIILVYVIIHFTSEIYQWRVPKLLSQNTHCVKSQL